MTPERAAERRSRIGGSDVAKIVDGRWHELWLEKTGRAEPEDLSWVLRCKSASSPSRSTLHSSSMPLGIRCSPAAISTSTPTTLHQHDAQWLDLDRRTPSDRAVQARLRVRQN